MPAWLKAGELSSWRIGELTHWQTKRKAKEKAARAKSKSLVHCVNRTRNKVSAKRGSKRDGEKEGRGREGKVGAGRGMERQLPKPVPDREQRTVVWQLLQNLTVFRKIFAIRCELRQLQMAATKRRRGEGEGEGRSVQRVPPCAAKGDWQQQLEQQQISRRKDWHW